jgi:N-acetylglucosaminyldiphosphoundecaprenol N-acetyl-beta-D-mannosaminyltransferase
MKRNEAEDIMFMGVKISNVSYRRAYDTLCGIVNNNGKGYVCLNDVGNIIEATRDNDMRMAINQSTFSLPDGMPLAWYGRLVGCTEIERISGMSIMKRMFSERDGFKHYLLGDTEQTIACVIEEAKKLNDEIRIVGHSPPFKNFTEEDNREIMRKVKRADPDIIWVSFGGGKQEKWMHQQLQSLDRGVMIGAGAAFKWLIGDIVSPPKIIQEMGLQWTYRLVQEVARNPKAARNFCKNRKFVRNKVTFLVNLPQQVTLARKSLKQNDAENSGRGMPLH